jgi:light-regulated signal transduction histidine kinase (bacteriophytochrome)
MSAPLKDGARVFGALNVYAGEPLAFDEEERRLMVELATNLSRGILALRTRAERDRSAAALQALNETLERRVAARTASLEATNRELEAFTYSVAHDLRTPLRHVHGFVTLLAEEYADAFDERGRSYIGHVVRGSEQMGRLIDDLLNLSRIGRQQLVPQVVGLKRLVEDVCRQLEPDVAGRDVRWDIGELPFIECDPALIRQVFLNLLANAAKFTRPRSAARIEVGATQREGETTLYVRDNGVGFNMKYADKLFGVFQRLHRQEDFEGTGVGLVTVQRIVQKHGGRIWADAQLDRGATFYFTLPAAAFPEDAAPAQDGATKPELATTVAGGD